MSARIVAPFLVAGLLAALTAVPVDAQTTKAAHPAAKASATAKTAAKTPAASAAKSIGKFGAWEGFVLASKTGNVCYAAAHPAKSENAPKVRGLADVAITDRPADKSVEVVSFTPGFTFKKDAPASLAVGATKFDLYTDGNLAWTRDDKSVVAALKKGGTMAFQSMPDKGGPITDHYALNGLPQALAAIGKACAAK